MRTVCIASCHRGKGSYLSMIIKRNRSHPSVGITHMIILSEKSYEGESRGIPHNASRYIKTNGSMLVNLVLGWYLCATNAGIYFINLLYIKTCMKFTHCFLQTSRYFLHLVTLSEQNIAQSNTLSDSTSNIFKLLQHC